MIRTFLACVLLACLAPAAVAADPPTYWQDVRPILRKHCIVCHSERKLSEVELSAGLALDKPELVRKNPKVLVPGKPDESLLAKLLTSRDKKRAMPLDADSLPEADIETIRKWIAAGAPDGTVPKETDTGSVAVGPAKVRKLDVTFATRAVLPKTAGLSGPLEVTLPVGPLPLVAAVAFSPDGKRLATGVYGRVTVWDLEAAKPVKFLTNVLGAVNDLKFSPDGALLAVSGGQPSARGDLRLFDTKDWKLVRSLGGHLDTVSGVAFSPDGATLASASFDKTVRLWDVKTGKVLHTYGGHSDSVYAVAFGPGGEWYATASKDRTGRLVDAATGKGRLTFSGMEQEVLAVAVGSDGQVVTSGFETRVSWWDPKTAERLRRTGGPGTASHELAFNAKGTLLAIAGGDGTVRLADAKTGTPGKPLAVGSAVFAVALDADGKRVATGAADGTVKLWDAADARLLATLWSATGDNWLSLTPEGYAAGAEVTLAAAAWKAGGKPIADAKLLAPLLEAAVVAKATAGQKVPDAVWK
jgi:WD40 repeat protein